MLKMLEGLVGSGICHRVVWSNVCVVQWYERMFLLDLKLMWSTRATRHFLPVNDGKTALSRLWWAVSPFSLLITFLSFYSVFLTSG